MKKESKPNAEGKGQSMLEAKRTLKKAPSRIMETVGKRPGLFILRKCGDDYFALLQPELDERRRLLLRGVHRESSSAARKHGGAAQLERALYRIEVAARTGDVEAWSKAHAEEAYAELVQSLGGRIANLRRAKNEVEAHSAAKECRDLFAESIARIVANQFPPTIPGVASDGEMECGVYLNVKFLPDEPIGLKARAAIKKFAALVAINEARRMCEELERLPFKSEVQARLEVLGFRFSARSKDQRGDWADVFSRAGLAGLPEEESARKLPGGRPPAM